MNMLVLCRNGWIIFIRSPEYSVYTSSLQLIADRLEYYPVLLPFAEY